MQCLVTIIDIMEITTPTSTPKRILKRATFILDMYKLDIELYIMATNKDVPYKAIQLCKKYKADTSDVKEGAVGYVLTFPKAPGVFYIVLSAESLDINTITHETDHLRSYILQHQGIPQDGDETSANLNGYINEKIFRFLYTHNFPITY